MLWIYPLISEKNDLMLDSNLCFYDFGLYLEFNIIWNFIWIVLKFI